MRWLIAMVINASLLAWESLMIAAEPPPAHDPGKGSLDDPSSGEGTKAGWEELVPSDLFAFGYQQSSFGNRERFDDLDLPPSLFHG